MTRLPCTARSRPRRHRWGFSLIETLLAAGVLSFGMLALSAVQQSLLGQEPELRQAVQIAHDQLAVAQLLPLHALAPGSEARPAPWIELPGREPGELPVPLGAGADPYLYRVHSRVLEEAPGRHRIELRVDWTSADGRSRSIELHGLREQEALRS